MSDRVTDVDSISALDFNPVAPCIFPLHSQGLLGCVPEQLASWYMQCPSCNEVCAVCNGLKGWLFKNLQTTSLRQCNLCQDKFLFTQIVWTPIGAVS